MQEATGPATRREEQVSEAGEILRSVGDRVEFGFWETLHDLLFKIPHILAFLLAIAAGWLLGRLLGHLVARRMDRRDKRDLGRLLGTVLHWLTALITGLFAVTILFPAITSSHILSVLGVGSVAVGFILKDILQNLLSGIIILVREPYTIRRATRSRWASSEGVVEEFETRATHIRTIDQRLVIIPNAMVFSNTVTVNTNLAYRMTSYTLSVAYNGDPRRAMEVVLDAIQAANGVLPEPPPQIAIKHSAITRSTSSLYMRPAPPQSSRSEHGARSCWRFTMPAARMASPCPIRRM